MGGSRPQATVIQPVGVQQQPGAIAPVPSAVSYANAFSGCYGYGMSDHIYRMCPSMAMLRSEGKCYVNERNKVCIGPADKGGPEVRKASPSQPMSQAVEAAAPLFPHLFLTAAPKPASALFDSVPGFRMPAAVIKTPKRNLNQYRYRLPAVLKYIRAW